MIKAIIFDFDGVIVDTELDRFIFLKKELNKYGYKLNKSDFDKIIGRKTIDALKDIFPKIPKIVIEKIYQKRKEILNKQILNMKPISGLLQFLKSIHQRYVLALSTGTKKDIAHAYLKKYDLRKYFDVIITGENFENSKPDPEGFRITLEKLNFDSSEVTIIEDSEPGITAAKRLHCKVFGLKNKHNSFHVKKADMIFNTYYELMNYLKKK